MSDVPNPDILRTMLALYDRRNERGNDSRFTSLTAGFMARSTTPIADPLLSTGEITVIPSEIPFCDLQYVYRRELICALDTMPPTSQIINLRRQDSERVARCYILTLNQFTEWFREVDSRIMLNPEASSMMLVEPRYASFEGRRNAYYNHLFQRRTMYDVVTE